MELAILLVSVVLAVVSLPVALEAALELVERRSRRADGGRQDDDVTQDDRRPAESSLRHLLEARLRLPREVVETELATLITQGADLRERGAALPDEYEWIEPWKFMTWRQDLDRWNEQVTHALAKTFTSDVIAHDFARLAALEEGPFPTPFDALVSFGASLSRALNILVSTYDRLDLFDEEPPPGTKVASLASRLNWRTWSALKRLGAVIGALLAAAGSIIAIMTFALKPPWREDSQARTGSAPGFVTTTVALPTTVTTSTAAPPPLPPGAWPDRPTFTWKRPATHVTLNSIADNPQVGDERAFAKAAFSLRSAAEAAYKRTLLVQRGDVIYLRIYYDNDSAPNLHLTATNVRVRVLLPLQSRQKIKIPVYIKSDNANPKTIMDVVTLVAAHPINVSYIRGSAQLWSGYVRGLSLADSITAPSGALIGARRADGRIDSDGGSGGWVSLRLRVHA
jgi:hypothetical protein